MTPRNHVKNLIDTVINAGARLVIVDIDLSRKTPTEGLEEYIDLEKYSEKYIDPKLQVLVYLNLFLYLVH